MSVTDDIAAARPLLWANPDRGSADAAVADAIAGIADAGDRLERHRARLADRLPELAATGGRLRSPLRDATALAEPGCGRLFVKADHELPVAGSIKLRGATHAVLEIAERVDRPETERIVVGSTGNLGLGVGLVARALGFAATVHMSVEARAWKKARLRAAGVEVVEHAGDYEHALIAARDAAAVDPHAHFVDDEHSRPLLHGYGTAAAEVAGQLDAASVRVDTEHPLVVHLPCGVGGAPAGLAVGLHARFGAAVHVLFAEPTQAPCVLLALLGTGRPSIYDAGLTLDTIADGLAVPRASALAVAVSRPILAGVFTVTDDELLRHLTRAWERAGWRIEPSAAAGFVGPARVRDAGLVPSARASHLVWTTGGRLLPPGEHETWLTRAKETPR